MKVNLALPVLEVLGETYSFRFKGKAMLRENARIGMKVYFGRRNGEKTLGEIVKLNPTKAKVKTLEERGRSDRHFVGQEWGVPYNLMEPADGATVELGKMLPQSAPVVREPLKYNPFNQDNTILEAILGVYSGLSPENLTADGELPQSAVRQRYAELQRKLKGLQMAFGRNVDETEIFDWYRSKQEYERSRQAS